ncbi:hypothetical protein [Pandoraea sp.]|uniref:hypothetical protein n=1 Tax=Pandoraea sp. TaxID=1883445 RepID=UPI0035B24CB4
MIKPPSPALSPDSMRVRHRGDAGASQTRVAQPWVRAHPEDAGGDAPGILPSPSSITLTRGQSFHAYVSRGTVFHVQQGCAVLGLAPRWLSASVWRDVVSLAAGQVRVVETPGWMTLTSDAGARIALRESTGDARHRAGWRAHATGRWQRIRERFGF